MRWSSGLGVGALALALTACGGGGASDDDFADGSGEDIAKAAVADMKSASSLRLSGEVTNDGQTFDLDVAITTEGDCEGTISVDDQGSAEILTVGDENWFRPDDQFWKSFAGPQAEQITQIVGSKWVVMPPDESGFAELCDLDQFLEELEDPDEGEEVANDGTEDVDGQEAVVLSGESDDGEPVKAYVAVDDPHYILKLEVSGGDEPGTLTFSDFDEDLGIEAPPEDEVVDLNQMGG